jgi:ectoine hydroxylase-related dioxygenase (phytanoyl-CoA dioxygenase family)
MHGWMLAGCWLDAGWMLAGCWLDVGWMLAICWLDADLGCTRLLAKAHESLQILIEIKPECEREARVIQ